MPHIHNATDWIVIRHYHQEFKWIYMLVELLVLENVWHTKIELSCIIIIRVKCSSSNTLRKFLANHLFR